MSNKIEYTVTAYHIYENNKHPEHKFYASTYEEAYKMCEEIIAELYNTDDADVELWADYMIPMPHNS